MFKLTAFPAADGDCLLLSFGETPPYCHVLIDGGRQGTYSILKPTLKAIAEVGEAIDLLVLSHIDADHIEGFLALVADREEGAAHPDLVRGGDLDTRAFTRRHCDLSPL